MTLARELADTAGRPQVDKNLLINGGMNVWQRGTNVTGISSTSTDGFLTTDRWETFCGGAIGTYTQSQSTDVPSGQGFGYSLKMDCTTAQASITAPATAVQIFQHIEAQNLQHLLFGTSSAKSITLSFWVKSNKTGTYIINLIKNDGGSRMISKAYTIDSASTWEKKTITLAGDETNAIANDNGAGLSVYFYLAAGSLYTSGTLQTSWGSYVFNNIAPGQVNLSDSTSNEWYLTGCQLEIGETATDFQFEPYEAIYRKCLRYNTRWTTTGGNFLALAAGTTNFNTSSWLELSCVVPLRTKPTLTYSSLTHFDMEHFDKQPTSIQLTGPATELKPSLNVGHSSQAVGSSALLIMDAAGYLNLDAEL